jgi:hypothetical protein
MSILVILPSFFWLLVLRTKSVEIDSAEFEIRQDVLSTESNVSIFQVESVVEKF